MNTRFFFYIYCPTYTKSITPPTFFQVLTLALLLLLLFTCCHIVLSAPIEEIYLKTSYYSITSLYCVIFIGHNVFSFSTRNKQQLLFPIPPLVPIFQFPINP